MSKWIGVPCKQCGKVFPIRPSLQRNGRGKFCSISCGAKFNALLRGQNGNPESKSRLCAIAREAYESIFGHPICEMCGTSEADVHHRDRDRKNNDPPNLQALCRSCHTILHNQAEPRRRKTVD